MRVHVDQELIFMTLGLSGGMLKDIARVRLHGDFLQFTELLRHPIQHRWPPKEKLLLAANTTGAAPAGVPDIVRLRQQDEGYILSSVCIDHNKRDASARPAP